MILLMYNTSTDTIFVDKRLYILHINIYSTKEARTDFQVK